MVKEIWRPVVGYESLYEVSSFGRVRSLDRIIIYPNGRKHFYKGQIMKSHKDKYGYLVILLSKNGIDKNYFIHRLVAETFIPNPDNLPQVNHKSEVKTENFVWNLEWISNMDNVIYSQGKQVEQYTIEGNLIATYPSAGKAARQNGLYRTNISNCCLGKLKTVGGFIWRYA